MKDRAGSGPKATVSGERPTGALLSYQNEQAGIDGTAAQDRR